MIKPKVKVEHLGQDHMARITAAIKKAHGSYVTVGWPADKKYPGQDVSVAQVALFNEFGTYSEDGTPHTPARPFMRPAINENKQALEHLRIDSVTKVAFMGVDIETALMEMGNAAKAMIVAKINSNVPPPNAPSTLARKAAKGRGQQTLIDSGLMRDSIEVKVVLSAGLKAEKEEAAKLKEQREKAKHERAHERQAYRKAAQASKAKARDAKKAQKSAQKSIKSQVKKAAKGIRKAGKNIKKAGLKKQKTTTRALKKGIVQTQKTVKTSVRSGLKAASKGIRNAAKRISGSPKGRARNKPTTTDKG